MRNNAGQLSPTHKDKFANSINDKETKFTVTPPRGQESVNIPNDEEEEEQEEQEDKDDDDDDNEKEEEEMVQITNNEFSDRSGFKEMTRNIYQDKIQGLREACKRNNIKNNRYYFTGTSNTTNL